MNPFFERWRQGTARLAFYRKAQTIYDIHSPAVYLLAREMVENRKTYYILEEMRQLRRIWSRNTRRIRRTPLGAGSRAGLEAETVRVSELVRRSAVSARAGRYLFHLARIRHPATLLDLGTGPGFSAAYLAAGSLQGRCYTVEGCPRTAELAAQTFARLGASNIHPVVSGFTEALKGAVDFGSGLDLLHLDGDHRWDAVRQIWDLSLPYLHEQSVVVISDIHWSEDMEHAWEWLQQRPEVTYTIDLFELGILFLDPLPVQKSHYRLVPARWKPWRLGFAPKLPTS